MKRKWVKGVVATGVIGCLLAGCASEKRHIWMDWTSLGRLKLSQEKKDREPEARLRKKQELSMTPQGWIRLHRTA